MRSLRGAIGMLMLAIVAGPAVAKDYILATASTTGTFYPVGVGISRIVTESLEDAGIRLQAVSSAGSAENVRLLKKGEADFAFINGFFAAQAYSGKGRYEQRPAKHLRAVASLWQTVEHFIVRHDQVQQRTLTDLASLDGRFSISQRNSGSAGTGLAILDALELERGNDIHLEWLSYRQSVQAMRNGRLAGANTPGGVPVAAVTEALATMGPEAVSILRISDDQLRAIDTAYPGVWSRFVIPAGTYPGVDEPVQSAGVGTVLMANRDVPDRVVRQVLGVIFDRLGAVHEVHPAAKEVTLETALDGIGTPLHPGAEAFYRTRKLTLPRRLLSADAQP
ncbi:TAXI family TRAP transporter solute-binding subunit [Arhodomonas sp. AD133]|uniref:TAXI family TRAP transporter solute-binding subunit n=1 Tax=Arhodomonas sp. AD133 TaxID=3415009 RepID=UPI003EC150A6